MQKCPKCGFEHKEYSKSENDTILMCLRCKHKWVSTQSQQLKQLSQYKYSTKIDSQVILNVKKGAASKVPSNMLISRLKEKHAKTYLNDREFNKADSTLHKSKLSAGEINKKFTEAVKDNKNILDLKNNIYKPSIKKQSKNNINTSKADSFEEGNPNVNEHYSDIVLKDLIKDGVVNNKEQKSTIKEVPNYKVNTSAKLDISNSYDKNYNPRGVGNKSVVPNLDTKNQQINKEYVLKNKDQNTKYDKQINENSSYINSDKEYIADLDTEFGLSEPNSTNNSSETNSTIEKKRSPGNYFDKVKKLVNPKQPSVIPNHKANTVSLNTDYKSYISDHKDDIKPTSNKPSSYKDIISGMKAGLSHKSAENMNLNKGNINTEYNLKPENKNQIQKDANPPDSYSKIVMNLEPTSKYSNKETIEKKKDQLKPFKAKTASNVEDLRKKFAIADLQSTLEPKTSKLIDNKYKDYLKKKITLKNKSDNKVLKQDSTKSYQDSSSKNNIINSGVKVLGNKERLAQKREIKSSFSEDINRLSTRLDKIQERKRALGTFSRNRVRRTEIKPESNQLPNIRQRRSTIDKYDKVENKISLNLKDKNFFDSSKYNSAYVENVKNLENKANVNEIVNIKQNNYNQNRSQDKNQITKEKLSNKSEVIKKDPFINKKNKIKMPKEFRSILPKVELNLLSSIRSGINGLFNLFNSEPKIAGQDQKSRLFFGVIQFPKKGFLKYILRNISQVRNFAIYSVLFVAMAMFLLLEDNVVILHSKDKKEKVIVDPNFGSPNSKEQMQNGKYVTPNSIDGNLPLLLDDKQKLKYTPEAKVDVKIGSNKEEFAVERDKMLTPEAVQNKLSTSSKIDNYKANLKNNQDQSSGSKVQSLLTNYKLSWLHFTSNIFSDIKISQTYNTWETRSGKSILQIQVMFSNSSKTDKYLIKNLKVTFLDIKGLEVGSRIVTINKMLSPNEYNNFLLKIIDAPSGTLSSRVFIQESVKY